MFKYFQGYLGIFRDIDTYSATFTGVQLERRGKPPLLFLKIEESALIFEKKALIVFIFGLNFPFKMQFKEYTGEKTPKCFPGHIFLMFLTKYLSKCRSSTKPPLPSVICTETFYYILHQTHS